MPWQSKITKKRYSKDLMRPATTCILVRRTKTPTPKGLESKLGICPGWNLPYGFLFGKWKPAKLPIKNSTHVGKKT